MTAERQPEPTDKEATLRLERELNAVTGRKLRALRASNDVTQMQVAERTGMSQQQIQKYENAAARMSVGMAIQMAAAAGGRFAEILPEGAHLLNAGVSENIVALTLAYERLGDDDKELVKRIVDRLQAKEG